MNGFKMIFNYSKKIRQPEEGFKALAEGKIYWQGAKTDQLSYHNETMNIALVGNALALNEEKCTLRDLKLIKHMIGLYGQDFIHHIKGAFIVVTQLSDQISIYRDPLGLKTIYYTSSAQGPWYFSTSLDYLTEIAGAVIDRNGMLDLFSMAPSCQEGNTFFKNIYELKMGHALHISKNKTSFECYYHPDNLHEVKSFEEIKKDVKMILEKSVEDNLEEGHCASFLSGGIDSSILCAITAAKRPDLSTYSLEYEGNSDYFKGYSYQTTEDHDFIERMKERYHMNHECFICNQSELAELLLPSMLAHEGPGMADIDSAMLWLCRKTKEKEDWVLSGECSDEFFGGYPWFYRQDLLEKGGFGWIRSLDERNRCLNEKMKKMDFEGYLNDVYQKTVQAVDIDPFVSKEENEIKKIMYMTTHQFMQTLVKRQNAMSEAAGIEVRVPFADLDLFNYLWNVPWKYKFYQGKEKGLLREIYKDALPKEVAERKKNPFPKTYHPKYTELVAEKLQQSIREENSALKLFYDMDKLNQLIQERGSSIQTPWYGQLMMGPQYLAYLYQIDQWFKIKKIKVEF